MMVCSISEHGDYPMPSILRNKFEGCLYVENFLKGDLCYAGFDGSRMTSPEASVLTLTTSRLFPCARINNGLLPTRVPTVRIFGWEGQ
ncbi:hypothetical protein MLD38_030233 [Melastoma candidum]|uniref:Uncharacterized protein n=1 Tax=Melastoma candidum TaxID=119954 RepID=A0ACB9MKN6_9MYRT|nr:hypothetical protein MLD38_030233 [Melastoma candidum]